MIKKFSLTSRVQHAVICSAAMAADVGLSLLVVFGLFGELIEKRMYANCVRVYQQSPLCLAEDLPKRP
ncbi:hypothetical protein BKD09_19475 [Bradyrhizobium japonicum]|uniref:Uncharacterized protein n=1 Tax=Bradyrhizobium japonicum TaxID=375 RepID=A0A1L3FB33_BRAJP|nr:hypothetical protein BKD09_19475 [Bradyrhizobium japonicum]